MQKTRTPFSILILVIFFSTGCHRYGGVTVQYPTTPAMILPQNVRNIAVINRTLSPGSTIKPTTWQKIGAVVKNQVEGATDQLASDDALKGIFDAAMQTRGVSIIIPPVTHYIGTGTRTTPEIMNWDTVKQICAANNADGLLVLEMFNSKTDVATAVVNKAINAIMTRSIPTQVAGQVHVNVQCFWRLYDPSQMRIVDEYETSKTMTFSEGGGMVPVGSPDQLQKVAYANGGEYISRFLPNYSAVRRTMYRRAYGQKANHQFLIAYRKAEVSDWQGALQIYEQLAQTNRRKNAGRACLNAAVANEVMGKVPEAVSWAQKSYVDYRNRIADYYQNSLKTRMSIEY
ncbi:MAG TPA: DUF6340 family protein [Chitinophagales bacterium]